jgi:hypothetical protein
VSSRVICEVKIGGTRENLKIGGGCSPRLDLTKMPKVPKETALDSPTEYLGLSTCTVLKDMFFFVPPS